jgi:predicted ATPase/DNA-binding SARP family transcriptional activator/DNA-binding CsgD family transcriptional regulator
VRVRLLGGFGVSVGDRNVPKEAWSLRKAASLIKLLTLSQGHALHREQIMDTLWPNLSKRAASNNLRQALHAARTAFYLDPHLSARVLASHEERIVLCPEGVVWVDTEAFEESARGARRAKDHSAYEAAIDLYAGELLPEDRYEEWAEGPRAHLRGLYLSLLFELASLYEERGDFEQAETVLGKLLAEEPANEGAHASLMRLYALKGRITEALAQYKRLEEMLLRNLGMEPSASVRALREEISCGRYPPLLEVPHTPETEGVITSPNNNLPTPRTSFVGREREMVEIKRELAMTRLLTLTGAGGSGKTRLALEIARDLAGTYSEGVWFVDLAPLSEPDLVPQALAATLEIQEQPGRPLTETLLKVLHSKNLLLVLDNCEHLIEAMGTLIDLLLTRCPGVRVLATSREPLGVEGEVLWQVPTLCVPEPGRQLKLEELRGYESSRLFVQRARARSSSFATSAEDAVAVAEICRHLEGLPLAIELAAATVGVLSVSQISGMLGDELRLLNSGSRTVPARHQTLRGALDWSYALLSEPERVLFGRLSVFAGSFTLEAAEAVCRGEDIEQEDVLDLLGRLVDKSLVVARVAGKDIRYRLLEPVRQYALQKLEESAEAEDISKAHAVFFLKFAEKADKGLNSPAHTAWIAQLETEHDNLRAALAWALERDETDLGLRLAGALGEFWYVRGHLNEGRQWLEAILAKDGSTTALPRTRALARAGYIAWEQGDFEQATALSEEGLALARKLGDRAGVAAALLTLGTVALYRNNREKATALLEEALALRRASGDSAGVSRVLQHLGLWAVTQQEFVHAAALFEEGLRLARETGDKLQIMLLLGQGALAYIGLGDYQQTSALCAEALELSRELEHMHGLAFILHVSALAASAQGRPLRSARLWGAAETLLEALGTNLSPVGRYHYMSYIAAARAQTEETAWEDAQAEGSQMSPAEAVAYASLSKETAYTPEHLSAAISKGIPLTRREQEIAKLVAQGLTNRQISKELFISERTVASHLGRIFKKLKIHSREQIKELLQEK